MSYKIREDPKYPNKFADALAAARAEVTVGAEYRHYKGGLYRIIDVALHSEDPEQILVIYQNLKQPELVWARPIEMWNETVTLPDGSTVNRFAVTKD
jgi:hypothetical protein